MNYLLWMFAIVLAFVFLVAGALKLFRYDFARERMSWVADVPRWLAVCIAILEILGALGLVLPAVTGLSPGLTAYAAAGLALLTASAAIFHLTRREYQDLSLDVLLFLMAGFVAIGRLALVPLV